LTTKQTILKLRPRARLISVIGNELISDEFVAIVELVKNAFDADATKVSVEFHGDPERFASISVSDNGIGMDLNTVIGSWLEPGTALKRRESSSPRGRTYQGAKGIGRFAAARLAHELYMETKQAGKSDGIKVLLDWQAFDDDSYLDEVPLKYETGKISNLTRGTRLTLRKLRRKWEEKDFGQLYSRLAKLLSPFDEISDFDISLTVPGFPELSGQISPPDIIEQPLYHFAGKVDSKGVCNGKLLIDEKKITFKPRKLGPGKSTPVCGPFEFEIRAWDRDLPALLPIQEEFGLTAKEIRDVLNTYSGVSIYRDGFRVYPYGERGNDWLNLDLRSRQVPARNLANNQIIAAIKISRQTNPELQDRSNREGLIKNDAYEALQQWFREVLKLLEIARQRSKRKEAIDEENEDEDDENVEEEDEEDTDSSTKGHIQPILKSLDLTDTVREVQQELGRTHKVSKLIANTSDRVKEGVDHLQQIFSRLLLSAGIGHLVDIVLHEIGSPVGKLRRQLKLIEKEIDKRFGKQESAHFARDFESMYRWLEDIVVIRDRLDPQSPSRRGKASAFDVVQAISDFIELYRAVLEKQKIDLEIDAPDSIPTVKMARSVLDQILANLVDNAIYWIIREKGIGEGGRILVKIKRLKHGFTLEVADDGPGVEHQDIPYIFDAYVSNKPDGIGLGLYIARLLIEPYGSLNYSDDSPFGGACFKAVFNDKVGL